MPPLATATSATNATSGAPNGHDMSHDERVDLMMKHNGLTREQAEVEAAKWAAWDRGLYPYRAKPYPTRGGNKGLGCWDGLGRGWRGIEASWTSCSHHGVGSVSSRKKESTT